MIPSRQESHHSTSTSSSSSSPTTIASSDRVIRDRDREDQSGIDCSPASVPSSKCWRDYRTGKSVVCRLRSTAVEFWNPGAAARIHRKSCGWKISWTQRDSHANSSHEASLESIFKRREELTKHSVYTHFPKDRNCENCQRTKIARTPCRRRNDETVPFAEKVGDLITADHKVLSENCESRNNHRYAIVKQDLATQWIQTYPCKTKTSQETQRSLQKFLEPDRNPKVIFGIWAKLLKIFPGIIVRQHHTDRRLMWLLKEQCAE